MTEKRPEKQPPAPSETVMRFGPAGADEGYRGKSADMPAYLAGLGLDAYEYQCGRGVAIGEQTAATLGQNAREQGVALSLHAPYFISLTNPERREGNIAYIRDAVTAAGWMGAGRVVVHTGALMGMSRPQALQNAMETMRAVLDAARDEGWREDVALCPETMGKIGQLGTLDEVLALCRLDGRLVPCVDFGHLYARTKGACNGQDAFAAVLDGMENALGLERARACHIHFSIIEFTDGGEKRHRTFADPGGFGPDWESLCRLLCRRAYHPTVICESRGTQSDDASAMREIYAAMRKEHL